MKILSPDDLSMGILVILPPYFKMIKIEIFGRALCEIYINCFNYDEPFKMFSGNSSFSLVHTILLPVLSCALCSEVEIDFV